MRPCNSPPFAEKKRHGPTLAVKHQITGGEEGEKKRGGEQAPLVFPSKQKEEKKSSFVRKEGGKPLLRISERAEDSGNGPVLPPSSRKVKIKQKESLPENGGKGGEVKRMRRCVICPGGGRGKEAPL